MFFSATSNARFLEIPQESCVVTIEKAGITWKENRLSITQVYASRDNPLSQVFKGHGMYQEGEMAHLNHGNKQNSPAKEKI